MIKKYDGAKAEKSGSSEKLPAGGYVAQIKSAEVKTFDWGEQLIISFDIAEGDYRDFFAADWRGNTNPDRKWRGTYRATIPDENNQYFESQKRTFNNIMYALEESNRGYAFDWDEAKLKGLMVGVLFRDKEWEYNGSTGWTTECCKLVPVEDIRSENFKVPAPKPLKSGNSSPSSAPASSGSEMSAVTDIADDDLPF